MNKKICYILFYIISVLIFSNCASIAPPGGGPADIQAPYLIENNIIPLSKTNISRNQKIILPFNERIYPPSAISSIRVEPEIDISIRIRNNSIYIQPKQNWTKQFKIFISRNLSDYSKNKLDKPIQLNFSLLDNIVSNNIGGALFNIDSTKFYELALIDDNLSIISKTESDSDGKFNFMISENSSNNYILVIENKLSENFVDDIRSSNYGLSNITTIGNNNLIYISKPLYRLNINSINLINDNYGEIILSNGNKKFLLLNNPFMKDLCIDNNNYIYKDYNFLDSLKIDMNLSNYIENYSISKSLVLSNQILDTLSASINKTIMYNDSLLIEFTEPIIIDSNLNPFYILDEDSTSYVLDYNYINPHSIHINNLNRYTKININCLAIDDLNNNKLCKDSLSLDINLENKIVDTNFGEINGTINYKGQYNLIVEVINLDTKEVIQQKVENNYFVFNKLINGNYQIWAYEDINSVSDNYFSGTLEPFVQSAKFVVYNKNVYVRSNWTNSISINFE